MANVVYAITEDFPKSEIFGIVSQMRSCAVSIPSNIAEGWMRQHTNEYIQFVYHSLGPCGELETQLILSETMGYVSKDSVMPITEELNHVVRMLRNPVKGLRKCADPDGFP